MKFYKLPLFLSLVLGLFILGSCSDDEGTGGGSTPSVDPIASFQFQIDATDFNTVTFSNFSDNADSYGWDFGDGNMSTEESPTHTYAGGGEYEVTLTATNSTTSHTSSKTVSIVDPNSAIKDLTGETSKVWKLSRNIAEEEYPLQVGPTDRSQIWWAYGLNDPIGSRPCIMEEEYIFNADGTFEYDSKGSVFADFGVWNDDVAGQCIDDQDAISMTGPNGEDLTAWGSGTFNFNFDPAASSLTLTGLGAHVGLPKVGTDAEYSVPQNEVIYTVTSIDTDGPVDKMYLETTIDGGYWQFLLVSYDDPSTEPDLPGAPPTTSFGFEIEGSTVAFTNNTVNGDSYSWDFGDGNMSSDESPTHTYATDGNYNVVLTAMNGNGTSTATVSLVISNSEFSEEVLHGNGLKIWKLNPQAGALAVGPGKGSGEWFATSLEDVMVRDCSFDDEFIFNNEERFIYNTNGDLWAEAYMGIDPPGCVMDGDLPAEASPWASSTHEFSVTEASGSEPAFITVTGVGAFIGLAKAYNGGEFAMPTPSDVSAVTYEVLSYVNNGESETLQITIDISDGQVGGAYWTFTLISE